MPAAAEFLDRAGTTSVHGQWVLDAAAFRAALQVPGDWAQMVVDLPATGFFKRAPMSFRIPEVEAGGRPFALDADCLRLWE